ncbi:MAG: hypothetical protein QMD76_07400 [Anaerosomatales bacterium]|jgi:hypothetical protein|nr:hypothetical protein [Coriobacteriia bacterium]MDI6693111.1 hypothetical protein [Anaerosomatales bacterium]GAV31390.1 hypothetical protein emb_1c0117 [Coriobacteriaceae bacterium EMTCatB1]
MNDSERVFLCYVLLVFAACAWALWRVARAKTVREAVEALPCALAPAWIPTGYLAFVAGGWDDVLKTLGWGLLVLGGLWLMRYGVDPDSGPEEVFPDPSHD